MLFDVYEMQIEHMVMSDVLFIFLVTVAVAALCWFDRPPVLLCAAAGLMIGYAGIVRSVGEPLLIVLVAGLLLRRVDWKRTAVLLVAGVLPIAGYMVWYHGFYGQYALDTSSGTFLYSRVSTFAECSQMTLPADLKVLCDPRPLAQRPTSQEYLWSVDTPLYKFSRGNQFSPAANKMAGQFARDAIESQPLAYAKAVLKDTLHTFTWNRTQSDLTGSGPSFQFEPVVAPVTANKTLWWVMYYPQDKSALLRYAGPSLGQPTVTKPFSSIIQAYQKVFYLRGTMLGVILLLGAAGIIARWRRWGGLALLPWAVAAVLIILPPMTAGFSYRYVLTAVPIACLAAGLALSREPRSSRKAARRAAARRRRLRRPRSRRRPRRPGTSQRAGAQCAAGRPISHGTRPAASVSSRNSVRCRPRAPAAGTCTGPASDRASATAPAFSCAGGQDPDLPGRVDRRQRQRQPRRRRLRRAAHRDHRPVVVQRRHAREQRRDVALGADAQQQDVERGHRAVIFRRGRLAQPRRVAGRRRLGFAAVRAAGRRHGVDPGRIDVDVIEQGGARAGLVPLLVPGRLEPLVPPPDVHVPPVHRVAGRGRRELGEHGGADPAAGEHQRGGAAGRGRVHQPGDQPRRDRLGQQRGVPVDDDLRSAHGPAISCPAAAARRSCTGSACTGVGRPGQPERVGLPVVVGPPLAEQPGQGLRVNVVGVEPAQFLGEQFGLVAAVQGDPPVRLADLGQRGGPAVVAGDGDLAVLGLEPDVGDARAP